MSLINHIAHNYSRISKFVYSRFFRNKQTIVAYSCVLASRTFYDRGHDDGGRMLAVDSDRAS